MRGDQASFGLRNDHQLGSPPRARGAGAVGVDRVQHGRITPRARGAADRPLSFCSFVRITPACAGSRSSRRPGYQAQRDHPRVRGEQSLARVLLTRHAGSPPRARGAVRRSRRAGRPVGITPACAGSRIRRTGAGVSWRDHPRVRGEQVWPGSWRRCSAGSPPRARGAGPHPEVRRQSHRITPACAGSREGGA